MLLSIPLRGAPADLLKTIIASVAEGKDQLSMLDLSVESGYSLSTVQRSIRVLQQHAYIAIAQEGGGGRAHRYQVLERPARTARRLDIPASTLAALSVALSAIVGGCTLC